MTVIIFLIVLAVLIFVHELGHFIVAKWNGIRVDEFKIGFGPKLLAWERGGTSYGLNLIPFGGYVKIHGENPDDESIHGPDSHRSFVNKNGWQQVAVLFAGVFFNFLFAWLLYTIVFINGITADPVGFEKYKQTFSNERVMITNVSDGSPAKKVGLQIGDVIKTVNEKPFANIEEIQGTINNSQGKDIKIGYMRGNISGNIDISPVKGLVADRWAIGIAMSDVVDMNLPFFSALYEGVRYTLVMIRETIVGLYHFFGSIFVGQANFSDVAGPIGIAGIVGGAAKMGITYLLMVTALISINLGVINLIPFPALDGGRILFVIIEAIIGRRIDPKYANTVNAVGFALLMALMVIVTYKDIAKLVVGN